MKGEANSAIPSTIWPSTKPTSKNKVQSVESCTSAFLKVKSEREDLADRTSPVVVKREVRKLSSLHMVLWCFVESVYGRVSEMESCTTKP